MKDQDLEGLYDLISRSDDELLLGNFIDFFCSPKITASKKFSVSTGATVVTTIAMSPDQRFVAFGGMNCFVRLYMVGNSACKLSKRFEKQISSIVLSSTGDWLGVGCLGGACQWLNATTGDLKWMWEHTNDIHSLAVDGNDSLIAIGGADCSVTVYSLVTAGKVYRFRDIAPICSVTFGERTSHVLELEDGQRTSGMRDVILADGGKLESMIRDRALTSVLLEGTILHRSDELGSSDAWHALHEAFNSKRVMAIVVLLVISSFIVNLLDSGGEINRLGAEQFDYTVSCIFILELVLRVICHVHVEKHLAFFFKNPLNLVDAAVAAIDGSLLAIAAADKISSRALTFASWLPLLRSGRFLRLGRFCRFAQVVSRGLDAGVNEYDVLLNDGTKLRKVAQSSITTLAARSQLGYLKRRREPSSPVSPHLLSKGSLALARPSLTPNRTSMLRRMASSDDITKSGRSPTESFQRRISRALGFNKSSAKVQTSPVGATRRFRVSRADMMKDDDPEAARERYMEKASQRMQRFEEGTPIEIRVKARIHHSQNEKLLAMGGETQQALVWQYDISPSQSDQTDGLHGAAVLAAGLGGARRRASVEIKTSSHETFTAQEAKHRHSQTFTHTVNSVCLSGDGRRLAGGDANGVVIVYDFEAHCEVFRWTEPSQILGVDLSYIGDRLAICGDAKVARMFHVQTGAPIYEQQSEDPLFSVKISRDGKTIATGFEGKLNVNSIDHGAQYNSFELNNVIRSISVDRAGDVVAMGCDDGRIVAYDLALKNLTEPRWTRTHDKKVWVVAVSPDGRFVAAGDYADTVTVYGAATGVKAWSKSSWDYKGAPFTWGLAFSGDSTMLAIGRWDAHAYLVDVNSWTIVANIKRGDRVYSVSLDHLGQRVAVAGRDREAVVYSIAPGGQADARSVDSIFSVTHNAFVYAVALSTDGKHMAVGCVDSVVCTYSVNMKTLTNRIFYGGLVQSVAFSSDAKSLAIGGDEKSVDVWSLVDKDKPSRVLALPRQGSVASVAFSDTSLCFVAGSLATVYGMGGGECEWQDRPAFEVIADMINHPSALTTTLKRHPFVLNVTNPISGESLLQFIVREQNMERVELMLSANCRLGLIQDTKGHTALKTALKYKQKQVVEMMLYTMVSNIQEHPSALEPFMRHRVEIAAQYPDLFLEFIKTTQLVREESLAPAGKNTALLLSATQFLVSGSEERTPSLLWSTVLEAGSQKLAAKNGNGSLLKLDDSGRRAADMLSSSTRMDLIDPAALQRIMVVSLRVPFEGAVGMSHGGVARPETTLLYLISQAARSRQDFTIFDCMLVKAMLQFKWEA